MVPDDNPSGGTHRWHGAIGIENPGVHLLGVCGARPPTHHTAALHRRAAVKRKPGDGSSSGGPSSDVDRWTALEPSIITTVAWAFARLDVLHLELMEHLVARVIDTADAFDAANTSMLLWSLAVLQYAHQPLLRCLADRIPHLCESDGHWLRAERFADFACDTRRGHENLLNTIWALAQMAVDNPLAMQSLLSYLDCHVVSPPPLASLNIGKQKNG